MKNSFINLGPGLPVQNIETSFQHQFTIMHIDTGLP